MPWALSACGGLSVNAQLDQFSVDVQDALHQLDAGWGMPTSWYHDATIFRFEMDHIYAREWQYFAPMQKLLNPGDRVVGQVAGIPIFVVRADDGELRGFINMCRHRGHPVVQEDGNKRSLVCAYHGWTYNLNGSLKRAPQCGAEPGFDPTELGLLPIAVDSWGARCICKS